MKIAGFDISSLAVDFVLLDETTDHADWTRIELAGGTPFERARTLRLLFPSRSFWEDHGVYLAAFEDPFSRQSHTAKALGLVTGAAAALLPSQLATVQTPPAEWKRIFTGAANADKQTVRMHAIARGFDIDPRTSTDAFDAYGIAWAVRALNRQAIEKGKAA